MEEKHTMAAVFRWIGAISGFGFSVAAVLLLCIAGARLVQNTFHLGSWVMMVGILAGLCAAGGVVYGFVRKALRQPGEKDG